MLKLPKIAFGLSCGVGILLGNPQTPSQPAKADNTRENQKERTGATTADQQKENKADRELARKIRQAVVGDKSLSTYAHNVKIVVQNGVVTLKGPVRSDQEKAAVEAKAREIAGASAIHNEVTIAPSTK